MAECKFNNESIKGFTMTCDYCGGKNVSLIYSFQYYSSWTGYDHDLTFVCRDCKRVADLAID